VARLVEFLVSVEARHNLGVVRTERALTLSSLKTS